MSTLLDGKTTASVIKEELAQAVIQRKNNGQKIPHLAAVLVGKDGASQTYVNSKVKTCAAIGFQSSLIQLSETISEAELLEKVVQLNNDPKIDGYIVQLPLPCHIDEKKITLAIDPRKDVDGFHPINLGNMVLNIPGFLPATPAGIMELLDRYKVPTEGKHCVVIGRSHIVGSPISILMARNTTPGNATVTLTHSKTKNLKTITQKADIIVIALGKPEFLTADMVKEGAVIIDVGINRVPDTSKKKGYRLTGDVAYESVSKKVAFITPVPGGVGPMTIVSLMMNTLKAMELNNK